MFPHQVMTEVSTASVDLWLWFVFSWLHLLFSEVVEEPRSPIQSAAASTWNSLMMTHSEEILPTGEFSPSQREKQVSICQITSFRSAAFGHQGKREHTLGFVRKSSTLTVSLKALHFLCSNLYLLQVDSIWQKTTK